MVVDEIDDPVVEVDGGQNLKDAGVAIRIVYEALSDCLGVVAVIPRVEVKNEPLRIPRQVRMRSYCEDQPREVATVRERAVGRRLAGGLHAVFSSNFSVPGGSDSHACLVSGQGVAT